MDPSILLLIINYLLIFIVMVFVVLEVAEVRHKNIFEFVCIVFIIKAEAIA